MTHPIENLFGAPSKLSPAVRKLGYSGSPLPLDEWLRLREIIASTQTACGSKRVNLPPVIVSCSHCAVSMLKMACDVSKHLTRGHQNFYCSPECWSKSTNEQRHGARVCSRCAGPAPRRASWGSPNRGRIFCSKDCMEQERREEFEARVLARMKPCERCNAMFVPHNAETRFCGKECAARAHSSAMLREKNPRWKDGANVERSKPHNVKRYREMRPLVMKRDGQRCVLCESTTRLHVHHIDENPTNNRAVNLVTLCQPCHLKVHFSEQRATLSQQLSAYTETPMSTTYRWKTRNVSSQTTS